MQMLPFPTGEARRNRSPLPLSPKGRVPVISNSAIILIDKPGSPDKKPLLLQKVLFSPLLKWNCENLRKGGTERFLLVTEEAWLEEVRACCPDGLCLAYGQEDLEDRIAAFSREAEGKVITITLPVWLSLGGAYFLDQSEELPWGSGFCGVFRVEKGTAASGIDFLDLGEAFAPDPEQEPPLALRIKDFEDLDRVQYLARLDKLNEFRMNGVRMLDPETVYADAGVQVGEGTLLLPNTILRGNTHIGKDCEIGPNSMLRDAVTGDGVTVNASQLAECEVESGTRIGPWCNIRPGSHLGKEVVIGDFVETKNSTIGDGTWVSHLTYIGDADVGDHCNFGCGTITVNFDGVEKRRTTVGNSVFVGCNSNLIAPVTVEDGAFIAAGSTVTDSVPADALSIGRPRQNIKPGWAAEHFKKQQS